MSLRRLLQLPALTHLTSIPRTTTTIQATARATTTTTTTLHRTFTTTMSNLADTQPSEASKVISDVSKQEGGPYKGSTAAQMQSETTKQRNLEDAAEKVGSKLDTAPGTITTEDAQLLHSRDSRAMGGQQPPKDSLASQAQSVAAANEQGATVQTNTPVNPAEQSKIDREANYAEMADKVTKKMADEPDAVTKEEADKLHSRETKAFGATEKGGVASQAQSLASKNAGDTKI